MKKLLIFGDSFGTEKAEHPRQSSTLRFHDYLRDRKYFSSIETYAIGGADLWSQFKKFSSIYTGSEEVILFETSPGRVTLNTDTLHGRYVGLPEAEYKIIKDSSNPVHVYMRDYFRYLMRDDYDKFLNRSMIEKIKLLCPHILIIPCFTDSVTTIISGNTKLAVLGSVTLNENEIFLKQGKITDSRLYIDLRKNHLTEENHVVLAEQILEYYKFGIPLNFYKYKLPYLSDFDKYFIKV